MMRTYDVMGWVDETQTPLCEQGVEAFGIIDAAGVALSRMRARSGGHPVRITCIVEVVEIERRGPIALAVQFERSAA